MLRNICARLMRTVNFSFLAKGCPIFEEEGGGLLSNFSVLIFWQIDASKWIVRTDGGNDSQKERRTESWEGRRGSICFREYSRQGYPYSQLSTWSYMNDSFQTLPFQLRSLFFNQLFPVEGWGRCSEERKRILYVRQYLATCCKIRMPSGSYRNLKAFEFYRID